MTDEAGYLFWPWLCVAVGLFGGLVLHNEWLGFLIVIGGLIIAWEFVHWLDSLLHE